MSKIYVVVEFNHDIKNMSAEDVGISVFTTRERAENFIIDAAKRDAEANKIAATFTDYESAETHFYDGLETSIAIVERTI